MPHSSFEATHNEQHVGCCNASHSEPIHHLQCFVWQSNDQLLSISNFEDVSIYTIKTAIVSVLTSSAVDCWFDPNRVKTESIKFVLVISTLSTTH
jgi:predicted acetyltransferase